MLDLGKGERERSIEVTTRYWSGQIYSNSLKFLPGLW